jgi:hypothetical protein
VNVTEKNQNIMLLSIKTWVLFIIIKTEWLVYISVFCHHEALWKPFEQRMK